ncbi:MAG: transporter substrate-binding domain-containing protein [Caldilineaceae bacterium]|nr:transporter substrate-binding domain-containing protein [Caldilineaceae bacterium]MCB9124584.1 transporter substrate-binding domain-containing protein [Caldilineaceae bacterium]
MSRLFKYVAPLLVVLLVVAGCAAPVAAPAAPAGEAAAPAESGSAAAADLLSEVQARGKLIVSTDPAYPPQSELVADAAPPADTKCSGDEKPANQFTGFDIDTAAEIAKRLGVEVCFVTPDWTLITAGGWAGRWDLSIGSMTITPERMEKLYFSQPYYTTPAAFFVHQDNTTYTQPADLSGKKVGGCSGCTYEAYIDGTLSIPGETIDFVVTDAEFAGYDTDVPALEDLALGDGVRLDAVLTALPTGQGYIADGGPLKQLGEPVYFEYLAGAMDKAAAIDTQSFQDAVNKAIQEMHADGTLKTLSEQYYGTDLAAAGATFDLAALNQ